MDAVWVIFVSITVFVGEQTKISSTGVIQASFSPIIDTTSVQNAITVVKDDGAPLPPNLTFTYAWYNNNRTIRLNHLTPFEYKTTYRVKVDPDIAVSKNGVPLNPTDPLARPNEW